MNVAYAATALLNAPCLRFLYSIYAAGTDGVSTRSLLLAALAADGVSTRSATHPSVIGVRAHEALHRYQRVGHSGRLSFVELPPKTQRVEYVQLRRCSFVPASDLSDVLRTASGIRWANHDSISFEG